MATEGNDRTGLRNLSFSRAAEITGGENVLILAPHPGDESLNCGGLIAELCRLGRPPFVMVLDDGSASHPHSSDYSADRLAHLHERETRAAVRHLGLPSARLLMVGLLDGSIPSAEGAIFDAIVRAIALVMWARDCNVILAPAPNTPDPTHEATYRIAQAVVAETGVGILLYPGYHCRVPPDMRATDNLPGYRLDISAHLPAKQSAIAAHATVQGAVVPDDPTGRSWTPTMFTEPYEVFFTPTGDRGQGCSTL
jgi:LmbE family N-acetylglucosaminyl deacetylase